MSARRVLRGDSFDLHYRQAESEGGARLGWIVPKRLARAASLRNAIKRQGREAFRLIAAEIPSCDLVLRLKQPLVGIRAADKSLQALWRHEIETLLQRLQATPTT